MKIAIVRGKFTNPYELQNYYELKNKHEVTVFASLDPIASISDFKVKHLLSPMDMPDFPFKLPILNRIFTDTHILFNLESLLESFDIAYVAETYYGFTQQAIKSKLQGGVKKIVSLCWENIPHNNEGIYGRKNYKQKSFKHIDHFICPTELAKIALISEGCHPDKISVIPLGIDLQNFTNNHTKHNLIEMLFVGRFEKEKGVVELLNSFNSLQSKYPNLHLTMVGEGSQKKFVELFIKENKLENKITVTKSDYATINANYKNADIFVLPSKPTKYWQEQYGMVLLEAMASALPIVTTSSGAIPEVVRDAALVCKPGDVNDLSKSIERLIKDEKLRKDLSIKALNRAKKRYDASKVSSVILNLFQDLIK